MNAQQIINSVSQDVRKVLDSSGQSAQVLFDYVDRIQKDCLHTSIYSWLNYATTNISTIAGTASYTTTPTTIRRIVGVYDRTLERIILPIDKATQPIAQRESTEPAPGQQAESQALAFDSKMLKTQTGLPEYFRFIGPNTIIFYPAPQSVLSINITYEAQVATITSPTTALTLPDDALDMVIAGVNYLANLYLAKHDIAQFWAQIYQQLKAGQSLV